MTEKEEKELLKLTRANNRMLTTVCKALHLVPVTEKEERDMQILRRANENLADKVNSELNNMENVPDTYDENALGNLFSKASDIYGDVLAEDYLDTDKYAKGDES